MEAAAGNPAWQTIASSDGAPHDSGMNQRVSQLANSVSELRGTIKGAAWGIGLFAALLAAFLGYMGLQLGMVTDEVRATAARLDARMDRIEDKIDALPAELRGIADSITGAISATKDGQPPVIILERPSGARPPTQD